MIFNDKPYYNEPGFEFTNAGNRVEQYNRVVELLTIKHAMLYWLNERLANPDANKEGESTTAATPSAKISAIHESLAQTGQALAHTEVLHAMNHPQHDTLLSLLLETSALINPPPHAPNSSTAWTSALPMSLQAVATAPDSTPMFFPNPSQSNSHHVPPGYLDYNRSPAQSPKLSNLDDNTWGDIVRKHFETKADAIMQRAREWQAKGRKAQSFGNTIQHQMPGLVKELEERLKVHGFLK